MFVLKLIIFTALVSVHQCRLPDKVYCVNLECNQPISKARTLLNYNSPDDDLMSFRGNAEAIVFMKSAGTNPDLWYASIDGKSGFVSKQFLRESRVYVKDPEHILPVQVRKKRAEEVQPDRVQQTHEVVEGTTIYTTETSGIDSQYDSTTPEGPNAYDQETPPINNDDYADALPELDSRRNNLNDNESIQTEQSDYADALPEVDARKNNNLSNENESLQAKPQSDYEFNQQTTPEPLSDYGDTASKEYVPNQTDERPDQLAYSDENSIKQAKANRRSLIEDSPNNDYPKATSEECDDCKGEPKILETEVAVSSEATEKASDSQENNLSQQIKETPDNKATFKEVIDNVDDHDVSDLSYPELLSREDLKKSRRYEDVPPLTESQESTTPAETDTILTTTESIEPVTETTEPVTETTSIIPETTETETTTSEPTTTPRHGQPGKIPELISIPSPKPEVPTIDIFNGEDLPKVTIPALEAVKQWNQEASNMATEPATETISEMEPTMATLPEVGPGPAMETLPPDYEEKYETYGTISPVQPKRRNWETADEHLESSAESTKEPNLESTTPAYNQDSDVESYRTESTTLEPYLMSDTSYIKQEDIDDDGGGGFTSILTSLSSLWSTDAPQSNENEPDEHKSYETDNKVEVQSWYSFLSYFPTAFMYKGDTKALYPTGNGCHKEDYFDGTGSQSNRLFTFLLTTGTSVLLFCLGYYYLDNRRQDSKFIATINALQRDLLFATKECEILKEELTTTKTKLGRIEDSSFGMDDMVQSLKEEIDELKAHNERLRTSLDDNEKLLRVSENTASELQSELSEVENTLSELLAERTNSEDQIAELNGKIQAFEEELMAVSRDRDNFQLKYVSAEAGLEESKKLKKQLDDLNEKVKEAQNTIALQKHEIIALKDTIKELKNGLSGNVDVGSLIDHTEIKAKLAKALEERKNFESKYEIEQKERSRLSEELQSAQQSLQTTSQQATEALTRLEVLGKYFQEREGELMKELSAKESLYLSKQGESVSTVEKMELLQQEIQRYKEKCDALTLELAEQESSRRAATSEAEARAHAAWLAARQARRDADAAKDDAAALRRKLASLTAADGAASPHRQAVSPLDSADGLLPPPLPLAFLPPPLLPPLPRPPPLGRLPSPHPPRYNDRRYSPDSRYSPESRYSPDTVRYSPDSRYSPRRHSPDARPRRSPYSPRSRRRSRERYEPGRNSRSRNGPAETEYTETEYNSDSPTRNSRRRPRYSRHSGPSSGSGCSSESEK